MSVGSSRKQVVNATKGLTTNHYWYYTGQCPHCSRSLVESSRVRTCCFCKGKIKWPIIVPKIRQVRFRL